MRDKNILFTDYIDSKNENEELKKFYKFVYEETEENLEKLMTSNKEKYSRIKLHDLEELPDEFEDLVDEIKKIYKSA